MQRIVLQAARFAEVILGNIFQRYKFVKLTLNSATESTACCDSGAAAIFYLLGRNKKIFFQPVKFSRN